MVSPTRVVFEGSERTKQVNLINGIADQWLQGLGDDGLTQVEVFACGSEAAVDALAAWLWRGPELASVTDVVSEELSLRQFSGFRIG